MAGKTVGLTLNVQTSDTAKRLAAVDLELINIANSLKEAKKLGQTDVYANLKQQQAGLRGEARELNKELTNQNKIFQAARFPSDSVEGLRVKLSDLKIEYFRLSKAVREGDVGLQLKRQINQVTSEVSKAEQGIGVFTRNVGNYKGAILDAIGGTGQFGSALQGLIAGGAAGAIGVAFNVGTEVVTQTVQNVQELIVTFRELERGVSQFTGASGRQLRDFSTDIKAIGDTFEVDYNDVLLSANSLSKQLGIDFGEALQLIQEGFLRGANANGEFLDSVREYPAFFKEARLSGEQFIAVISQGVNEGVFSDKAVDLIKEFNLRVRELTPATQTALEGIGITSQQIAKEIDENGIGGAFQLVQERLQVLKNDSPEVGAALADIFGGPGEDAGIQFIKTLDLTEGALQDIRKSSDDVLEANKRLADSQRALASEYTTSLRTIGIQVKTFFNNTLTTVTRALKFAVGGVGFFVKDQADAAIGQVKAVEQATNKYADSNENATNQTNKSAAAITKQITTIDSLQERLKGLREEQEKTEIGSPRFKALGKEIKAVERQINDALGKATKEADNFARGSIGFLNKQLEKLRKELEKAPNATIFNKVSDQIQGVERQLEVTEARFQRFRDAQKGIGNVVQTITTFDVTKFTQSEDLTPVGGIGSALQSQKIKEEEDTQNIIKGLRKETAEFSADLDEEETNRQKKEAEKRNEQIRAIAAVTADLVQSFIEGGIKSAEEFQKALLLIALEAIEKQFLIASFQLLSTQVATKGFAGVIAAGILQGVLTGAFAALKSGIQGKATGGEIETYSGAKVGQSKRITGRGEDTVLIAAYPGEVVLNNTQQARGERIYGKGFLGTLGVPGFASGGEVLLSGATPQIVNPNISLQRNTSQNDSTVIKESLAEFKAIARDLKAAISVLPDATGISVQQGVLQAGELSDRRKALRNDTQV